MTLNLTLISGGREQAAVVDIKTGIIAGWTGRDIVSMEKHIKELEDLGVKRPKFTPTFYRVSAARFTTAPSIEVVGDASSGEVEFVMMTHAGKTWIGVGSDHTDRQVETVDVTVSKQMCDKPISPVFWAFDEIADHWDKLTLKSTILEKGVRVDYQDGSVTKMRDPRELASLYDGGNGLPQNTIMYCGTLAAIGGIRPADRFEFSLHDPVLGRTLSHAYDISSIPASTGPKGA